MKNKIWKIGLSVIVVCIFFLLFWKNGEEAEKTVGKWNESHTIYTNGNDVSINEQEYDYLIEEYGSKEEVDQLTQDMVDASFFVGLQIQNQEFLSDLGGHVHDLPEGFQEIGKIQFISKFRYGMLDERKDFEATANVRFIASVGSKVYQNKSHSETILVEGDGGSYYVFTLDGTETTLEDIHTGTH